MAFDAQRGFLVDTRTSERLYFQYNPESVNDSSKAAWVEQKVLGVHHPRMQYASGEGRVIKFSLKFYLTDQKDNKSVLEKCNWLRSLVYPSTTSGSSLPLRAPARVLLNLGALYKGLPCVVSSVDIDYSKRFSSAIEPMYAEVDLELKEFRSQAIGFREVRRGQR